MKLKSLFMALLVMLSGVAMAQVQSGKVYRIVSGKYGTVITESLVEHTLSCVTKGGDTDYQQMWEFTQNEKGKYVISNVLTRRILQNESGTNVAFKTGTDSVFFAVKENANSVCKGYYNIDASSSAKGWGLHCASGATVVPWSYGPDKDGVSGTEWLFEEVSITEAQKEAAYAEYQAYNDVLENKDAIIAKVNGLFSDKAGTTLKAEYAKKSNDEIRELLKDVPENLVNVVLKVKNNTWATQSRANLGEKSFRINTYKPYSDVEKWYSILYTRLYSPLDHPTGICAESNKDILYVFVDQIPAGSKVYLSEMPGTGYFGVNTLLKAGLNIVPAANKNGVLYVRYTVDTHTGFSLDTRKGPKKLSDYPNITVHIEGGYVNGFWSKERGHNNDDWVYMRQNMFRNEDAIQAKGDYTLLDFRKKEFLAECPSNIEGIIQLWDFWNKTQQKYMALDRYYDYFNNLQLAMSDDGGFMDAGNYRTHYNNNTLNTIVNYDLLIRDAGSSWGPNHEIGHNNQYAFEIVGTSEVSNNALANMVIFDQGTHTSRGVNVAEQILDFENKVPYVLRGEKEYGQKLFSMTRMYFQLFLYFHAAEKKTDFYPELFEALRRDRLVGWSVTSQDTKDENGFYLNSVNGVNDQLKFVEKCCSIANMDLTEFFESWGFFIPLKNGFVGDYGHHWVYLLEEDIKACKERIKAKNYPKKGGHLMFLEDRVRRPMKKVSEINSDGNSGRSDYSWEYPVATGWAGLYGQWEDYKDETVKIANGAFFYVIKGDKVELKKVGSTAGVLGFKLYSGDGELLSFTNKHEMNIPAGTDRTKIKVVAAQPDGNDVVIEHVSKGPATLQKEALNASLEAAKRYLDRKLGSKEKKVGRFYPEALANLQTIYDNAVADSKKAAAEREKTDVEWSELLDTECQVVANNKEAMVLLEEGVTFSLKAITGNKGYMTAEGNGIITKSGMAQPQWQLEYAGVPNVYYLKSVDNGYIYDYGQMPIVDANAPTAAYAQKFAFGYSEAGDVYFSTYPDGLQSFGLNNSESSSVAKIPVAADGACWTIQYKSTLDEVKDATVEFCKQELDAALAEAEVLVEEIIDRYALGTMNIFNKKIIVTDESLTFAAQELYNTYYQVLNDAENASKYKEYLLVLREKIFNVQGKYIVTAPVTTYESKVLWYRLRNKETGKYLSVNAENELVPVASYEVDDNALWCFSPVSGDEYEMYSYAAKGYIYNEKYALLAGGEERTPVTVTYNKDVQAVSLSFDGIYKTATATTVLRGYKIVDSGTVVKLQKSSTQCWELELVAVEENEDLSVELYPAGIESVVEVVDNDNVIYDLQGRKVVNPTKGVYIQNGNKVILK